MAHELDEWLRVTDFIWRFGSATTFELAPNMAKIDGIVYGIMSHY
jgi:hypothetical protein